MDELTNDERDAAAFALRKLIVEIHHPHSPLLAPFRSALAKLDPASAPKPSPERAPLPEAPARSGDRRWARR
jgi:hypothetical protein